MKIYEVHIGMAGIEERVHTFKEFTLEILPRIVKLGYNTI
jgi:1,4-alpha-glucan branching enzyme